MLSWTLVAVVVPLLLLLLRRRARRTTTRGRRAAETGTFLATPIAAKPVLRAPEAANDDLLAPVLHEVERALRQAGHLR